MKQVIVLPAIEDQMAVDDGQRPENHFLREFATDGEVENYVDGVGAMYDLVEYEIRKEASLSLDVKIGSEKHHLTFTTEAEKNAYKQGLDDGDGFRAAKAITASDLEFETVLALVGSTPSPSA